MRRAAALLAITLLAAVTPARADLWQLTVECSSHDAIAAYLRDKAQSHVVATGTSSSGNQLVEIWANAGGHWQIVVTPADTRRACIIGNGVGWSLAWGPPA